MKRVIYALLATQGAPATLLAIATLLTIGIVTLSLKTTAASRDDGREGRGTIVGQVTDVSGTPLEGVVVSVKKGPSAVTGVGGIFELTAVKQRRRIILEFSKPGYVSTQAITSFRTTQDRGAGDNYEEDVDYDRDDSEEDGGRKLTRVTLNKAMLPSGATQPLDDPSDQYSQITIFGI